MASLFRMTAGILGWLALALQYWLVMTGNIGPEPIERSINFFSYFTILTNILAALALTLPWLAPQSAPGQFFSRPSVRTAIATYIIIVMAITYLVLRHLSNLEGWYVVADLILHYIMPILFVIDWLFLVPKDTLKPKDVIVWLAFPILYVIWTIIHGALSGFYPYPFLNVGELGYARVLMNMVVLLAIFLILGLLLVTGGRLIDKARRANAA
ncbi:MAG: hypothetical protein GEU91_01615 [Rhizobiales bacterium]|nr:hypothetical protein [Hyphomicrobiales bacterium]